MLNKFTISFKRFHHNRIKKNMSKGIIYTPRVRKSPFFEETLKYGATNFTTYNHMTMPVGYTTPEQEYQSLINDVTLWDVAAERQVEIIGEDASKFVQYMTPRNLSTFKDNFCRYAFMTDENGGIINDPLILKVEDMKWRICIADSDVLLYAKGIADSMKLRVKIHETNISTLAVQGPKSLDVMKKVFGDEISKLKFFNFNYYKFEGIDFMISKSGFSKQGGYEIYVENSKSGLKLYDYIIKIGNEYNLKPGCPNVIERIEGALLSYGNDMDNNDNPFECGLDKYINLESNIEFLGKKALQKVKLEGIKRKLMGVKINEKNINLTSELKLVDENKNTVGYLRSAAYSPKFKMIVGIAMINLDYCKDSQNFKININNKEASGSVCSLPMN